jgi:hypothetical protein
VKTIILELSCNLFLANLYAAIFFSDKTSAVIIFIVLGSVFIFLLFFPALIELKKPKDGGPRPIMDKILNTRIVMPKIISLNLVDIDKEESFDLPLSHRVEEIIKIFPNFEP